MTSIIALATSVMAIAPSVMAARRVAPPTTHSPRVTSISMFKDVPGYGEPKDLYGFDDAVVLPPLPSGESLQISELRAEDLEEEVWDQIASCVEREVEEVPVGAELWPAASALCRWQRDHAQELKGKTVLELGSGTGACGLYAAGAGASQVVLTDMGGDAVLDELVAANEAANRHLTTASTVHLAPLRWGDAAALEGLEEQVFLLQCESSSRRRRFDFVLASDITYHWTPFEALASTCAALLLADDDAAGSCSSTSSSARSPSSFAPPPPPPRLIFAHEHRSAPSERALGETLSRWDTGDDVLDAFKHELDKHGLELSLVRSERPTAEVRGAFRHWSADISVVEVRSRRS